MPRGLVVGQGADVEDRVVAAERELEAVLALGRAVAGPRVAAQPRQDRRDVVDEVDLHRRVQRPARSPAPRPTCPPGGAIKRPLAVGLGPDQPRARDLDDRRRERRLDHPGHVDRLARGELPVTRSWT